MSAAGTVAGAMTLDEARAAVAKGNNAANLDVARLSLDNYDPAGAQAALERYAAKLPRGTAPDPKASALAERADMMQSMLDRVEKIQIIDSIIVDAGDFFNAYRLSVPAGSLHHGTDVARTLPADMASVEPTSPVYVPESGAAMVWTENTSGSQSHTAVWQTDLLADGAWDAPHRLFDGKEIFGDTNSGVTAVATPYLMSDGMTMYFAANGTASLGGLDIFITRGDEDGFLQPQNVGMPYNSPYDDYMMVIDEFTGMGWWATDRNRIPGKVTIYRFIPSDLRVNYPPDTPGLADLARITSVAATHPAGADYSEILERVARVGHTSADADDEPEFLFALPGGKIYTSFDDFKSDTARRLMEEYLDTYDNWQLDMEDLADLRAAYRDGDRSQVAEIRRLETQINDTRKRLRSQANAVIAAECPQ